jgi:hypothetical protein
MTKASQGMAELIKRLKDHQIERIGLERGITAEETSAFMHAVAGLGRGEAADAAWAFPHIKVGRITADETQSDGIAGDMAAIRQLYSNAVAVAEDSPIFRRRSIPWRGWPTRSRRTAPPWWR